jgi:tRNA/rRNA methyltransferase
MINAPVIILVEPQLAQNVGKSARAMMNCGVRDLRLVRPSAKWLSQDARSTAAGADGILENAPVFDKVEDAVSDLHFVLATTARVRDRICLEMTPKTAAAHMVSSDLKNQRVGILFGPERCGLTNDDVALADGILTVPVNPDFSSLNLAQAVLLVCYEWYQAHLSPPPMIQHIGGGVLAPKEDLIGFFHHLEESLENAGYFRSDAMKPKMIRTLRGIFTRLALTAQEIRTLRGVVSDLVNPHGIFSRKRKKDEEMH